MLKVKLLPPPSTDAGRYTGITSAFQWEKPVEGVWQCSKKKGVHLLGSEFIRLGGLPECFNKDSVYIWGCFEVIEDDH